MRSRRRRTTLGSALVVAAVLSALAPASGQAAVTIESFTAAPSSAFAGAHADSTTSFSFKFLYGHEGASDLGGDANNVAVTLPPGLVANLNAVPKCPRALFDVSTLSAFGGGCPADTQIGIASLTIGIEILDGVDEQKLGVFNVEPGPNEPAFIGVEGTISAVGVVQPIIVKAAADDDYAITATAADVHETPLLAKLLASTVTLWGVPGAHERAGGSSNWGPGQPILNGRIAAEPASAWKPLMENPTSCSETPLTGLAVDTFQEPEVFTTATAGGPAMTECANVPFAPSVAVSPETSRAGVPTGLSVALTTPQSEDPEGLGTAELEKAVVRLPAGMGISPSAASALLEGCSDVQFGAGSDAPAECPAESVIGTDEVESPLLPESASNEEGKLTGKVFLGQPLSTDPTSGQMFRVFQELRGHGLDVKVPGSVVANPVTGQLTATFSGLPELPFQTFRLHLRGGPNAVLVNPQSCGPHTTTTELFPYSSPAVPATPSSTFTTSYDGAGAPCPATLPFAPAAAVTSLSSQAGAFSPATISFSRGDETQPLGRIEAKLPPGLLGYVSKVAVCEAAQAEVGTCQPESRIGTVTTAAGAGSDPLTVQGSVYLAHGSDGYPFMLSVVVPAVAGPYDLGNVVVPVWLQVNNDGSITAVSGSLPSILDGIPLDIRTVTVSLDRPGFTTNPTNCEALSLTGQATALSGALAPLTAPFQVSGCSSLPFAPSLTAATQGATSKANGASLTVRVSQKPGESDIRSVHVVIPKQLPTRLGTLNKACTDSQFAANPARCPPGSIIGTAVAYTPTLPVPLTGPAILVSHAGRSFPDVDSILQGDGVSVTLTGEGEIIHDTTSATYPAVPDVPITGFQLTLPEGPYSLFAANTTLCSTTLTMPTTITAQNGSTINQNTPINITGCPKPTITITKAKATGSTLAITVRTTVAGTIRLTGTGLQARTARNAKAGTSTLTLNLTRTGRRMAAHHNRLTLRTALSTTSQAIAKTTSIQL
jgi:hypothetical protein